MNNCLELKNVYKHFPGFSLQNISFTLPQGYIMGLIGPNGAGKTTTIRLILDLLETDEGMINVFGLDNVQKGHTIKQDIGVVFDSPFFVDNWKIEDTEAAISSFYEEWNHNTFEMMLKHFRLSRNKKIKELSRGMQMKLMLSCAFSHNAKLLILDEPTSGLDPVARDELLEILQEYIKDGKHSVLFSTHITTDLERIADYITFINNGKMFYTGSKDGFLDEFRLIKGGKVELTKILQNELIGLRHSDIGFEGLIRTKDARKYKHYVIDSVSIDDIIVFTNKEGAKL